MATRPGFPIPFPRGDYAMPRPVPSYVLARALAATTAESITVPTLEDGTRAKFVVFSCDADFYANCYATATVPSDVTDGTASELNPVSYQIPSDVTTISVISSGSAVITASFYS